jgi:hypothetical protein
MSSYGMIQALTGMRYDAVEGALHVNSQIGNFKCFLSTSTGFGVVDYADGKANLKVLFGDISVKKYIIDSASKSITKSSHQEK